MGYIIKEKYLIVNADDFGIDEEINRGIADCFIHGITKSVSIVANGLAFDDALNLVKNHTEVGVGVHLCLVDERPILSKDEVLSLVDNGGFLSKDYRRLLFKICTRKINFMEVENELDAQIRKVLDNGIIPTHIDSHQYTHLIPPIFNIAVRLAKKYNIRWVRYPKENGNIRFVPFVNFAKKAYLAIFSTYQLAALKNSGIGYADFSCGTAKNSRLNQGKIKNFLKSLLCGINDMTCHPGYNPQNKRYDAWKYNWREETETMTSETIKDLIKESNIKIANYAREKTYF